MYIFKNAVVSLWRNKGRNLLIGIIIIVIATASSVSLAIKNSADSLIESYENSMDVLATIGINRENMRGEMRLDKDASDEEREQSREDMVDMFSSISSISLEDIETYGNSEYVKEFYYQQSIGVNSETLEKASMEIGSSDDGSSKQFPRGDRGPSGKENFQNMSSSDFILIGYSSTSGMEEFISGKYSITDGEVSMDENTCVINSELATLNNIEIGDEITIYDASDEDNEITLTVSGIYEEISETADGMGMFTTSANTIITNTSVIDILVSVNGEISVSTTPTFVLTSKEVIGDFKAELTEKGLSEYLAVSTNLDEVDEQTITISNVSNFATTFLIITFIIGGVILFVINMINIRERKYEIGVLRTIGMKKSLLSLQFIFELFVVAVISLFIGAGIGASISVPVSNNLLQSEIESQNEKLSEVNNNFGGMKEMPMERVNGVANVSEFDSIDAVVDLEVLLQLLGIGILLTLISSSASMISIQKFSPLQILKERG